MDILAEGAVRKRFAGSRQSCSNIRAIIQEHAKIGSGAFKRQFPDTR
jgi:hypothetical protein